MNEEVKTSVREKDIWISDLAWYYHTQTNNGRIK